MIDPYFIKEPAAISFSGGRTSAYMLWRVLQSHGGTLPDYIKVVFANTGKEMPQTLDFVRDCGEQWGVDIIWVELCDLQRTVHDEKRNVIDRGYKIVDHATASRNGEPFDIFLDGMDALPNPIVRSCTASLKIRAIKWYLESIGFETPWTQLIGIRGDEPRRAANLHGKLSEGQEAWCPLFVDGVTAGDVGGFWKKQNFDLALHNDNGTTVEGNCDLCFLKSRGKRMSIIRENPHLADWWIAAERRKKQFFRRDEVSYAKMKIIATDQGNLFDFAEQESLGCFCGD